MSARHVEIHRPRKSNADLPSSIEAQKQICAVKREASDPLLLLLAAAVPDWTPNERQ